MACGVSSRATAASWRTTRRASSAASPRPCDALLLRPHPVTDEPGQRLEAREVRVLLPLAGDGRDGHVAGVVSGIELERGIELRDALQALAHLLGIPPGQVAPAAGVDEHRVAGEEAAFRALPLPARGARSVSGR